MRGSIWPFQIDAPRNIEQAEQDEEAPDNSEAHRTCVCVLRSLQIVAGHALQEPGHSMNGGHVLCFD